MTYYANVFFDFLLQKSLAGTLPATLAPFADRFAMQTADLDNARMRPFCALPGTGLRDSRIIKTKMRSTLLFGMENGGTSPLIMRPGSYVQRNPVQV